MILVSEGMSATRGFHSVVDKRGRGSIASTTAKVLIFLFLLFVIYFYNIRLIDFLQAGLEGYQIVPDYSDLTLNRIIELRVEKAPIHAKLTIPYPHSYNVTAPNGSVQPVQIIKSVKAFPRWTRLEKNKWGDDVMVWEFDAQPGDVIKVTISYSVRTYSTKWDIDAGISGTVDQIPQDLVNQYCHDEWHLSPEESAAWNGLKWRICPSNKTISDLAHRLADDKPTVYAKLKALYDYMDKNFQYHTGEPGLPKNAVQTLHDRYGDCDDQSILFISMARALGIPAWLEGGALYNFRSTLDINHDGIGDAWEGHAWANVYIPLENGGGMVATVDVVNNLFLIRDTNRFSEWIDNGVSERVEDYYQLWEYTYQGTVAPEITQSEYYITEEWHSYSSEEDILTI